MLTILILGALLALAVGALIFAVQRWQQRDREYRGLVERFRPVVDAEAERQRILAQAGAARAATDAEIARARGEWQAAALAWNTQRDQAHRELADLQARVARLRAELSALDEEANLQSIGFYRPRYNLSSSDQYQSRLEVIRRAQKQMLTDKSAAVCRTQWTVNGSVVEGRKQINQTLKLILRAFNGECDAAVAKVNYKNVGVMEARIVKAWETINGLVTVQECSITDRYLQLKLEELRLEHEYEEKVQEEKEEQRRIREQMREEEVAAREIEKAKLEAEREEHRYQEALRKAKADVENAAGAKQQKLLSQIEDLQRKLAEAQENKERALSRAQMTRAGHVYVISNLGSFGEKVFKIGMTRRLDPLDRVHELGDASVPFSFDVHAMIWSEDAPALENALHRHFHHRRVNAVNERKEFFNVDIEEIVGIVYKLHGEIQFTKSAEAKEYRQSLAIRKQAAESGKDVTHDAVDAASGGYTAAPPVIGVREGALQ